RRMARAQGHAAESRTAATLVRDRPPGLGADPSRNLGVRRPMAPPIQRDGAVAGERGLVGASTGSRRPMDARDAPASASGDPRPRAVDERDASASARSAVEDG